MNQSYTCKSPIVLLLKNFKLLFFFSFSVFFPTPDTIGQRTEDFNIKEASEMLALCCSYTFLELYGDDSQIIPEGYVKFYQSESVGMDNMYQLYIKDTTAYINFRGSTAEMVSWWENFHAAMVPASGEVLGDLGKLTYDFAFSEGAAVHSGYGLGLVFLFEDLEPQLAQLKSLGVKDIVITGHSQGGALANLLFALLKTDRDCDICKEFEYRVYAFAAPMVGNKIFCEEYNTRFCATHLSYNIINRKDPVPKLPFKFTDSISAAAILNSSKSYNWLKKHALPAKGYFLDKVFGRSNSYFNKLLADLVEIQLKGFTTNQLLFMNKVSSKQATKHFDKNIVLPDFITGLDYDRVGNVVRLPAFQYPKEIADSIVFQNSSVNENVTSEDRKKSKAKKGSWTYQHKPYNYYVQFLKEYQVESYNHLKRKYLFENL